MFIQRCGEVGDSNTGDDALEAQLYGVISTTDAGDVAKWTLDLADWAICTDGVPGWEPWDLLCAEAGEDNTATGDLAISGGAASVRLLFRDLRARLAYCSQETP